MRISNLLLDVVFLRSLGNTPSTFLKKSGDCSDQSLPVLNLTETTKQLQSYSITSFPHQFRPISCSTSVTNSNLDLMETPSILRLQSGNRTPLPDISKIRQRRKICRAALPSLIFFQHKKDLFSFKMALDLKCSSSLRVLQPKASKPQFPP